MSLVYQWRESPSRTPTWAGALIEPAYYACEELQTHSLGVVYARIVESVECNFRHEFRCIDGIHVVGAGFIVKGMDMHVGQCWSIQWAYVLPEYRARGAATPLYRKLLELAKRDGIPYSYTRRTDTGQYTMKYGGFRG